MIHGIISSGSGTSGPPIPTDPDWDKVVLLQGYEPSITTRDESRYGHVMTAVGNAAVSAVQKKFGDQSIRFDGSGDALTALDSADWHFSNAAFTIEMFVYPITIGTTPDFR